MSRDQSLPGAFVGTRAKTKDLRSYTIRVDGGEAYVNCRLPMMYGMYNLGHIRSTPLAPETTSALASVNIGVAEG